MYVAKVVNGVVQIYESKCGAFIRSVGSSGCKSAMAQGDEVMVTEKDNKVSVYHIPTGHRIRTI